MTDLAMTNFAFVADGTRQATLPDEIWKVVHALIDKTVGVRKPLQGKEIATRLGLAQPSVSTWVKGKGRPTYWNAQCVVRLIRDEFPLDQEIQAEARKALGVSPTDGDQNEG